MPKDKRLDPGETYLANIGFWKFCMDSYESGPAYMNGNHLFKHERETQASFDDRRKRAVPSGCARSVIKTYHSLMSRARVSRTTNNRQFLKFVNENCDRRGNGLSEFVMNTVFAPSQAVGWHFVLIDLPVPAVQPKSKKDEIDQGIEPYCISYDISSVINWAFSAAGALEFVTIQLPKGTYGNRNAKRIWDTDTWTDWAGGEAVGGGVHGLGRVPFAICYNERSVLDINVGVSAIQNIAYMNREVFNLHSLHQEFLYRQCYNFLATPAGSIVDKDGVKTVGTQNAIPLEPGDQLPAYIAPDVSPAGFNSQAIKDMVASIYHEAGLIDRSAEQVGQAQSGISRAFQFHNTNSLLTAKARNLEQFEIDLGDIWFAYMGGESDYVVSYPDNFDVRDTAQLVEEAKAVIELPLASDTLKREYLKKLVAQLVPNVDEETLQKITAELDAQVFGSSEPKTPQGQPGSIESRLARAF